MSNQEENRALREERAQLKKEVRSLRAKIKRRNVKVADLEARLSVTRGVCLRVTSFNSEIRAFLDTVLPPSLPSVEEAVLEVDQFSPNGADPIDQGYAETAIADWEEILRKGGEGSADQQTDPQI